MTPIAHMVSRQGSTGACPLKPLWLHDESSPCLTVFQSSYFIHNSSFTTRSFQVSRPSSSHRSTIFAQALPSLLVLHLCLDPHLPRTPYNLPPTRSRNSSSSSSQSRSSSSCRLCTPSPSTFQHTQGLTLPPRILSPRSIMAQSQRNVPHQARS